MVACDFTELSLARSIFDYRYSLFAASKVLMKTVDRALVLKTGSGNYKPVRSGRGIRDKQHWDAMGARTQSSGLFRSQLPMLLPVLNVDFGLGLCSFLPAAQGSYASTHTKRN